MMPRSPASLLVIDDQDANPSSLLERPRRRAAARQVKRHLGALARPALDPDPSAVLFKRCDTRSRDPDGAARERTLDGSKLLATSDSLIPTPVSAKATTT